MLGLDLCNVDEKINVNVSVGQNTVSRSRYTMVSVPYALMHSGKAMLSQAKLPDRCADCQYVELKVGERV